MKLNVNQIDIIFYLRDYFSENKFDLCNKIYQLLTWNTSWNIYFNITSAIHPSTFFF